VHCRQPLGCISACRRDELRVAVNVTSKRRFTPLRSIPEPHEGACGEQKLHATFREGSRTSLLSARAAPQELRKYFKQGAPSAYS
jgi:hypothetical protein